MAAVILEPVALEEPTDELLQGAQEYFEVIPDLACFGEAMTNTLPISALVGRRDFMELLDEVFFSFTFEERHFPWPLP